mmetsp:Transcript_20722/g.55408  ORF Transcript_20722/g.55408 Transcript_20722/m.55408 type:complete len:103 (+) Transcript_20722:480-788(+)
MCSHTSTQSLGTACGTKTFLTLRRNFERTFRTHTGWPGLKVSSRAGQRGSPEGLGCVEELRRNVACVAQEARISTFFRFGRVSLPAAYCQKQRMEEATAEAA